jgi:DNA-binding response OmpR family regulator
LSISLAICSGKKGAEFELMRAVDARLARVKFLGPELVMIDSASCGAAALELCRSIRSRKALPA